MASWAARSVNPAPSTVAFPAGSGHATPSHPVLARVLHRHAGLPRTTQPRQRRYPRLRTVVAGQSAVQLRQQFLPPGQERQPQHRTSGPGIIRPLNQLLQLGRDPGAQPLDQASQIAELRRAHLAAGLVPGTLVPARPVRGSPSRRASRRGCSCATTRSARCRIDRPGGTPDGTARRHPPETAISRANAGHPPATPADAEQLFTQLKCPVNPLEPGPATPRR